MCFISYRKYILQITQPYQYRCTQLQYRFALISEAPSKLLKSLFFIERLNDRARAQQIVLKKILTISSMIKCSIYISKRKGFFSHISVILRGIWILAIVCTRIRIRIFILLWLLWDTSHFIYLNPNHALDIDRNQALVRDNDIYHLRILLYKI